MKERTEMITKDNTTSSLATITVSATTEHMAIRDAKDAIAAYFQVITDEISIVSITARAEKRSANGTWFWEVDVTGTVR